MNGSWASPLPIPFEHSYALVTGEDVILRVGDTRRIYPLASVTKLLTSRAALVAVARGYCLLDEPAGPDSSTVRHLLAHTSGLPFESRTPIADPGVRRIYSNAGYEVLGEHIAACTGTPIGRWIEESVLEPLGMSSATVEGSVAHAGHGSVEDLILLAREFLRSCLLTEELATQAHQAQFPETAGVVPGYGRHTPCPWGLGPEIRGTKSPHWTAPTASPSVFGHFGVSGSFLWVDPERQTAAVFLGAEPFGAWHKENWSTLNAALASFVAGTPA